jgi:hypothetical protein
LVRERQMKKCDFQNKVELSEWPLKELWRNIWIIGFSKWQNAKFWEKRKITIFDLSEGRSISRRSNMLSISEEWKMDQFFRFGLNSSKFPKYVIVSHVTAIASPDVWKGTFRVPIKSWDIWILLTYSMDKRRRTVELIKCVVNHAFDQYSFPQKMVNIYTLNSLQIRRLSLWASLVVHIGNGVKFEQPGDRSVPEKWKSGLRRVSGISMSVLTSVFSLPRHNSWNIEIAPINHLITDHQIRRTNNISTFTFNSGYNAFVVHLSGQWIYESVLSDGLFISRSANPALPQFDR